MTAQQHQALSALINLRVVCSFTPLFGRQLLCLFFCLSSLIRHRQIYINPVFEILEKTQNTSQFFFCVREKVIDFMEPTALSDMKRFINRGHEARAPV